MKELGARIVIELSSIEQNSSQLTGIIYLQLGDEAFPEKGWNDFVVTILTMWLKAITSHENTFFFMDGPFNFKVTGSNLELWANHQLTTSHSIDRELLTYSILSEARAVIDHLEKNGCMHDSLKQLKRTYENVLTSLG